MPVGVVGSSAKRKRLQAVAGMSGARPRTGEDDVAVIDKSMANLQVVNLATISDLVRIPVPTALVAGDQLVMDAYGQFLNDSGSTANVIFTFGIGATVVANAALAQAAAATPRSWRFQMRVAVASPTSERVWGEFAITGTSANGVWSGPGVIGNLLGKAQDMTEDLAAGKDLFLRVTLGAAAPTLHMTRWAYLLWKL